MISPTLAHPTSAAARPGSVRPALPPDPGLDALLADVRLGSTAKTIAVALVKRWARFKDHAWPSDKTIGKAIGKSPGHVQRCLRELERLDYIRREATADVPNGRRLWLLWRAPGMSAGAQPTPAPARSTPRALARTKEVVIVNRETEPEFADPPSRPRPEPATVTPPSADSLPIEPEPPITAFPGILDLGVIGRPLAAPAPSVPTPDPGEPAPGRTRRLGLGLEELVKVVGATADPILAAELAKRTAPAPPPEPPPQSLTTPELLARLPGRHDLTVAAVHRLCADLADFKPATWNFCSRAVAAVITRASPASVLLDCHRQATGPRAKHRGRVFVTAWKREARPG